MVHVQQIDALEAANDIHSRGSRQYYVDYKFKRVSFSTGNRDDESANGVHILRVTSRIRLRSLNLKYCVVRNGLEVTSTHFILQIHLIYTN